MDPVRAGTEEDEEVWFEELNGLEWEEISGTGAVASSPFFPRELT
jgi:hypothetical protein